MNESCTIRLITCIKKVDGMNLYFMQTLKVKCVKMYMLNIFFLIPCKRLFNEHEHYCICLSDPSCKCLVQLML